MKFPEHHLQLFKCPIAPFTFSLLNYIQSIRRRGRPLKNSGLVLIIFFMRVFAAYHIFQAFSISYRDYLHIFYCH